MYDLKSLRQLLEKNDIKSFTDALIMKCEDLQKKHGVLAFALVLYDETIPEVRRLLRNEDYWSALDVISGERFIVFSIRDIEKTAISAAANDSIGFMVPISNKPISLKQYSAIVENLLGEKIRVTYPSILFFQVVDNCVYGFRVVQIERGPEYDVYRTIEDLFKSIAESLKTVTPENYMNQRDIFDNIIAREIDEGRKIKVIKSVFRGVKTFKEILSFIPGL